MSKSSRMVRRIKSETWRRLRKHWEAKHKETQDNRDFSPGPVEWREVLMEVRRNYHPGDLLAGRVNRRLGL